MGFSRILIYMMTFILGIVELFIVLRVFLKFFGANPETPFVNWIYETTRGLIAPFAGIFPAPVLEGGFVLEFSSIFALIIYAIIGYLVTELLEFISYNSAKYRLVEKREIVRE